MALAKLYTSKDMKLAMNVGKRSCSFQFIEGQAPKVHMNSDVGFALDFLQYEIGVLLSHAKFNGPVEDLVETIKGNILEYYKLNKVEEPKKES